jgi:hypothetical protein
MDQTFFDLVIRLRKTIGRIVGSLLAVITTQADIEKVHFVSQHFADTLLPLQDGPFHISTMYECLAPHGVSPSLVQPYTNPNNQVLKSNGLVSGASACSVLDHSI